MKFDKPAGRNPIDRLRVIGKPVSRVEGTLKVTGTATYAYEQHAAAPGAAYGVVLGAAIAKGRIAALDTRDAESDGDQLTLWTSVQQINWGVRDLAKTLGIAPASVRLLSPCIGGGFGGKGTILPDAVLAALGARHAGRPVKVALQRPLMFNNLTHRPATIQRIRIGATEDGLITAIGHESWSGNIAGGRPEAATAATRVLYAGANRMTRLRLAHLDLPESSAMRAPGEAPGMMGLEMAMDEMAEKLGIDPLAFRIRNDTQVDPENPAKPFSQRQFVACLRLWKPT